MILMKGGMWNLAPFWEWLKWVAQERDMSLMEATMKFLFALDFGEPTNWKIKKGDPHHVVRDDGLTIQLFLTTNLKGPLNKDGSTPWLADVYVLVYVNAKKKTGKTLGWASRADMEKKEFIDKKAKGYSMPAAKLRFGVPDARIRPGR